MKVPFFKKFSNEEFIFYNEKAIALEKAQSAGRVCIWQLIKFSCISQFNLLRFYIPEEELTCFFAVIS